MHITLIIKIMTSIHIIVSLMVNNNILFMILVLHISLMMVVSDILLVMFLSNLSLDSAKVYILLIM